MKKRLIIFSDNPTPIGAMRGIGAYRLRTAALTAGYSAKVIDFLSEFIDGGHADDLINRYIDCHTVVAFSTTWFQTPPDMKDSLSGSINVSGRAKIPSRDPQRWFDFLGKIKKIGAVTVFGGSNIFYFFNDPYRNLIDYFIVGFGDRDLVNLLDFLSGKNLLLNYRVQDGFRLIQTDNNFHIDEINTRFLSEDYLNHGEILPIEISRGCRFKCKFCFYPLNGRKKNDYVRSAQDLYDEFIYNYENFGTTKYRFLDDTFNESIEKLQHVYSVTARLPFQLQFESYIRHELLDHDQLELLAQIGLKSAILGIETLNKKSGESIGKGMSAEHTLAIVKNLRDRLPDCYIGTGMIIGLPNDSVDNLAWAYDLAPRSDLIDKINWFPLAIRYPSKIFQLSELEENYEKYGYIIDNADKQYLYQNWTNQHGLTFTKAMQIVSELETLSDINGTFSPMSRYALTLENIGISSIPNQFQNLTQKVIFNTLKYKRSYMKKILDEKCTIQN